MQNRTVNIALNWARKGFSFLLVLWIFSSCTISYSLTGASIAPSVKSFTIYNFPNRARTVNPALSDSFMEELRKKFNRQTSLDYRTSEGDLEFEGTIADYDVMPLSMRDSQQEAQNRLTVKIQVKFTNNTNHEQDFEKTFEAFSDFSSEVNFADVEDALVKDILEKIVDEVFKAAVANW